MAEWTDLLQKPNPPPTLDDYLKIAQLPSQIFQNRIAMENAMTQMNQNYIAQAMQQGQLNAAAPQQQGNPQAQALTMGAQQQQQAQFEKGLKLISAFQLAAGTDGLKKNWDIIKPLLPPQLQQADPNGFNQDGSYTDPKTGKTVTRTPDGKYHVSDSPHNVQELVSPDGKTAQKMEYNPKTQQYDIPVGGKYPVKSQVININQQQANTEAAEIAKGIMEGTQPPDLSGFGMSKVAPQVRSILAKEGYDLTKVTLDYKAQTKYMQSLNSTQQVRLRQATQFAYDSLGLVEGLAQQWKAGNFPPLNKLNLMAAKNGLYGQKAAAIATQLETQISDLTSELGTVYKGGNSSTDESLKLAAKNLDASWSEKVLLDNIGLIRRNLDIRRNSQKFTGATTTQTTQEPEKEKKVESRKEGETIADYLKRVQ